MSDDDDLKMTAERWLPGDTLLGPMEGIEGTQRDEPWMSLAEENMRTRNLIAVLAWQLHIFDLRPTETFTRRSHPRPGDLVLESSSLHRMNYPNDDRVQYRLGYLLGHRLEWAETDEEYHQSVRDGSYNPELEDRISVEVVYVQYGPNPEDICRWENCSFIAVPQTLKDFR
jgi:hypothetical protein